eukprot:scpid104676/ scgid26005/ 
MTSDCVSQPALGAVQPKTSEHWARHAGPNLLKQPVQWQVPSRLMCTTPSVVSQLWHADRAAWSASARPSQCAKLHIELTVSRSARHSVLETHVTRVNFTGHSRMHAHNKVYSHVVVHYLLMAILN